MIDRSQRSSVETGAVILVDLYLFVYLTLALLRVRRARDRLDESREEGRVQPLRGIQFFVGFVWLVNLLSTVLDFMPWRVDGLAITAFNSVIGIFAIFWLAWVPAPLFVPRRTPSDPSSILDPVRLPAVINIGEAPPASQGLENATPIAHAPDIIIKPEVDRDYPAAKPEEITRIVQRLKDSLEREQVYLDANLSLQGLASCVKTTRHKLSAVINSVYGVTFFQLLAGYRVRAAAQLLANPKEDHRTIADIAFACGFNTLSAFNAGFRAEMQQTPSQFRRKSRAELESTKNRGSASRHNT